MYIDKINILVIKYFLYFYFKNCMIFTGFKMVMKYFYVSYKRHIISNFFKKQSLTTPTNYDFKFVTPFRGKTFN